MIVILIIELVIVMITIIIEPLANETSRRAYEVASWALFGLHNYLRLLALRPMGRPTLNSPSLCSFNAEGFARGREKRRERALSSYVVPFFFLVVFAVVVVVVVGVSQLKWSSRRL